MSFGPTGQGVWSWPTTKLPLIARPGRTGGGGPDHFGAWNPTGGGITISRSGVGKYSVRWSGADPRILGQGNVQVTAVEYGTGTHCKVTGRGTESAQVQCYRPNGTPVDSYYSVMLGS